MGDESTTPLVMEFIRASEVVITVHQARSHDEFRSPDLNFTVWSPTALPIALVDSRLRLAGKASETLRSGLVVRRMDVSSPAYRSSCSLQRGARKVLV